MTVKPRSLNIIVHEEKRKLMKLNNELKNIVSNYQCNYFGVANISKYKNEIKVFGGDIVGGYKFGISSFQRLVDKHRQDSLSYRNQDRSTERSPNGSDFCCLKATPIDQED